MYKCRPTTSTNTKMNHYSTTHTGWVKNILSTKILQIKKKVSYVLLAFKIDVFKWSLYVVDVERTLKVFFLTLLIYIFWKNIIARFDFFSNTKTLFIYLPVEYIRKSGNMVLQRHNDKTNTNQNISDGF